MPKRKANIFKDFPPADPPVIPGLEPPKPGRRHCLRCRKQFNSWDVRRNQICPKCNSINYEVFTPKVSTLRWNTSDTGDEGANYGG